MPSPPGAHLAVKEQRLVVVGGGGVGKTAVTIRFVTSQFHNDGYNPTIEDSYRKQFVVDDEAVQLEILDTAGQEEYAVMADQWYKFGAGFLLVYSITDRPTFEAIPGFHQDILRSKDRPYVPCVVVSNKCDLGHLRAVGQTEGRDMAKSLHAPFIEASAVDGVNVDIAFRELVKLVRKDQRRLAPTAHHLLPTPFTMQPKPQEGSSSSSPTHRRPSSAKQEGKRNPKGDVGSGCCVLM